MKDKSYFISEYEAAEIVSMALSGNILNKDIAKRIGRNPGAVSYCLRRIGVKNTAKDKIIGKWNNIHAHLREPLLKYFLNHSAEECQKKFNLTASQFKSCITYAYKQPELTHIRKDNRRHDPWSTKELKFLLKHCGIMPRDWIAKELSRGGELGIKDRLELLGISSKNLNGLTLSQFRQAFGIEPKFFIQTKAGPGYGKYSPTFYKIIPWVWINTEIKNGRLKTHPMFVQLVSSMAIFQEWIFEGNALRKLKRIVK